MDDGCRVTLRAYASFTPSKVVWTSTPPKGRKGRKGPQGAPPRIVGSETHLRRMKWPYTNDAVEAPRDWEEFYSNLTAQDIVERWLMESKGVHKGYQRQYKILAPYTRGSETIGYCKIDFAWIPSRKDSTDNIVLLEVDEGEHYKAGFFTDRNREVAIIEHLQREYKNSRRILVIRFNPHEYNKLHKSDRSSDWPWTLGEKRETR